MQLKGLPISPAESVQIAGLRPFIFNRVGKITVEAADDSPRRRERPPESQFDKTRAAERYSC